MKKVNKNIFLFVDPVARALAHRNIEQYKRLRKDISAKNNPFAWCLAGMLALISSVYIEDFFLNHNGCHGN